MAALNLSLCLFFVLFIVAFLHPRVVHCGDEDDLIQGINSYRTILKLPPLSKNEKAKCLAENIADDLEDQNCNNTNGVNEKSINKNYQLATDENLEDCHILANSTHEGVIMPVCVHKLVPTLVLTNYTFTQYAQYLNNSKYTGIGAGCSDDWMVVVLTTNTTKGNFASDTSAASSLVSKVVWGCNMAALLWGLLVYLLY